MGTLGINFRRAVFWLALCSLVWFAVELVAFSGLELLDKLKGIRYEPVRFELTERNRRLVQRLIDDKAGQRTLSSTLGWTNKPGTRKKIDVDPARFSYTITINEQGLRGARTYPLNPDRDRVRILAFGDSFTFGAEVNGKDSWTESLSRFAPQVEVLNFGVPGFALDQALLRYEEEGKHFNPRIVLMGFMTENLRRHVNVYRPFLYRDGLPAAKPRFLLAGGSLELLPNPLPTPDHYRQLLDRESEVIALLGKHDQHYLMDYREGRFDVLPSVRLLKILRRNLRENRAADSVMLDDRFNPRSEAFQVTARLFERFSTAVINNGSKPVAVIFPHGDDIRNYRTDQSKSYTPLMEHLDRQEIEYIDVMDAFARAGRTHPPRDFLGPGGHYSPLGNMVVAHQLWKYLEARNLLNGPPALTR